MLANILERKKAFLDYKKKEFKNWDFSKGVSSWIRSKKLKIFYLFVLDIIGHENVCHDILERKNAFVERKKGTFLFFPEYLQTHFPGLFG